MDIRPLTTLSFSSDSSAGRAGRKLRGRNGLLLALLLGGLCAIGVFGAIARAASTTFTVTTTANSGAGSLRQAILDANGNSGTDTIAFNLPGPSLTIHPTSPLPVISDPGIVDGTTQPGYVGRPIVELQGVELIVTAGSSTVRGLVINRSGGWGVRLLGANGGNTLSNNFIGTEATGETGAGNVSGGVEVTSPNNTIGGSTGTTPGGACTGECNLISGHGMPAAGLYLHGAGSTGNVAIGNYFGTDDDGETRILNRFDIEIGPAATNNRIGGTTASARNVISGAEVYGVHLLQGANDNVIEGNYIGTNSAGTALVLNRNTGVFVETSTGNLIGGTGAGAGNVISGSNFFGVVLYTAAANNRVQGNIIGPAADGTTPLTGVTDLPDAGVSLHGPGVDPHDNLIGGTAAGAANRIARNRFGIDSDGPRNSFLRNSITANSGLGINLTKNVAGTFVDPNDFRDPDVSGEGDPWQNYPLITSATSNGFATTITGNLNSTPTSGPFNIELFSNAACDPLGAGEGDTYLGSTSVFTDANGDATFLALVPTAVPAGQVISATATDSSGSTSEFSACRPVTTGPGGGPNPAFVSGVKFDDQNANGGDDSEPRLPDWTIRAYIDSNQDGSLGAGENGLANQTTTNFLGAYQMILAPGSYVICEVAQANWTQTAPAPLNNRCGSQISGLAPSGHAVTMAAGQTAAGNDFGNSTAPSLITGVKFLDRDQDGVRASIGEPGLGGWTIRAYEDSNANGTLEASEITLAGEQETQPFGDGAFSLSVNPGSYVICEVAQANWTQTAPAPLNTRCGTEIPGLAPSGHAVTVGAGQTAAGNNFGNFAAASHITGVKFFDRNQDGLQAGSEPGLGGWTIRAFEDPNANGTLEASETTLAAQQQTQLSGNGAFDLSVDPGSYVVCEVAQANWTQTAPAPLNNRCGDQVSGLADSGHAVTVGAGQTAAGNDFGNFAFGTVSARGRVQTAQGPAIGFSAANDCNSSLSTRPSIVETLTAGRIWTKTSVTASSCTDQPPASPLGFDTQTGTATGTFGPSAPGGRNGQTGTLTWTYYDNSPDTVQFILRDNSSIIVFQVAAQTPTALRGTPGGVWTFGP